MTSISDFLNAFFFFVCLSHFFFVSYHGFIQKTIDSKVHFLSYSNVDFNLINSNFLNGSNIQPKNSIGSKSVEDKVDQDAGRKRKKIVISDSEESESEEAMTKKIRAEDISKTRTESGDVVMTEADDSQDVDKEIEEAAAEEKEEKQEQKETKAVIQIL